MARGSDGRRWLTHLGMPMLLATAAAAALLLLFPTATSPPPRCDGERLASGICLPRAWPPRRPHTHANEVPPYLERPPPAIDVSVGRQLFVDPFLVDAARSRGLVTRYYTPGVRSAPVIIPDRHWELAAAPGDLSVSTAYSGGVWWNPELALYQAWYQCGPLNRQCYATSPDVSASAHPVVRTHRLL